MAPHFSKESYESNVSNEEKALASFLGWKKQTMDTKATNIDGVMNTLHVVIENFLKAKIDDKSVRAPQIAVVSSLAAFMSGFQNLIFYRKISFENSNYFFKKKK